MTSRKLRNTILQVATLSKQDKVAVLSSEIERR